MKLDKFSPITVALKYLKEKTNISWTDKDILQAAQDKHHLYANPDRVSPVVVELHYSGVGKVSTRELPWQIAELSSQEIEQLITSGITYASYALGHETEVFMKLPEIDNPLDLDERLYMQYVEFLKPVRVTVDMVMVPAEFVEKIISGVIAWPLNLPQTAKIEDTLDIPTTEKKPWLELDAKDPTPEQPWYTPARYFARRLIENDSNLLIKRSLLAKKIAQQFKAVGIYKNYKAKSTYEASTILKALSNVSLG